MKGGNPEWRKQKRLHGRYGFQIKCIGASDDGKHVMVRFPNCAPFTITAREWEALELAKENP